MIIKAKQFHFIIRNHKVTLIIRIIRCPFQPNNSSSLKPKTLSKTRFQTSNNYHRIRNLLFKSPHKIRANNNKISKISSSSQVKISVSSDHHRIIAREGVTTTTIRITVDRISTITAEVVATTTTDPSNISKSNTTTTATMVVVDMVANISHRGSISIKPGNHKEEINSISSHMVVWAISKATTFIRNRTRVIIRIGASRTTTI